MTGHSEIQMPREVVLWDVGRLRPYERNPRTHSDEQVAKIAASILEFGFTNPILVDGEAGIIAGHGRLLAARKLGMTTVPVIELTHLTAEQRRALVIADNRLALDAGWDEELLAGELRALDDVDFDLSLTGFGEDELNDLLEDDDEVEEVATPDPPTDPVSRAGDLWRLGDHLVLCGDATNLEDVRRVAPVAAAMAFVDVPYDIGYRGSARQVMEGNARRPIANDDLGAEWEPFIEKVVANILASTRGAAYLCINWHRVHTLREVWLRSRGHISTVITWAKNTFVLGGGDYHPASELVLYGWREGAKRVWAGPDGEMNVWHIPKPAANPHHPAQKPIALVARAIRNSSRKGDVVLDTCAGSGSTLIAADQLGRRAACVEIDPAYVDVIIERWATATGKRAVLDGTGEAFDDVRASRKGA